MSQTVKVLKLYDQATIIPYEEYPIPGLDEFDFKILSGSRILFDLYINEISVGANVEIEVLNNFSLNDWVAYDSILTFSGNAQGHYKRILTDFNLFFKTKIKVIGGNAKCTLSISVFDNASTTRIENAEIDVHITDKDTSTRQHDSVRIGDGTDEVEVNPDGSFNVNIVNTSVLPEVIRTPFSSITNLVKNTKTVVGTYIAPVGKKSYIQRVTVGGDNIADYTLELNGSSLMRKRTWFNDALHTTFEFDGYSENGKELSPGDQLKMYVEHYRNDNGVFENTFQILEIG